MCENLSQINHYNLKRLLFGRASKFFLFRLKSKFICQINTFENRNKKKDAKSPLLIPPMHSWCYSNCRTYNDNLGQIFQNPKFATLGALKIRLTQHIFEPINAPLSGLFWDTEKCGLEE